MNKQENPPTGPIKGFTLFYSTGQVALTFQQCQTCGMKLGVYLQAQRGKTELSLADMADVAGYSVNYLRRVEAGRATINVYALYRICKALRCSYKRAMDLFVEDMAARRLWPGRKV